MNAGLRGVCAPPEASSPLSGACVSPLHAAIKFLETLKTPAHVLVAYSGGSDSTGLLTALARALQARPALGVKLSAATVDHRLRAESALEAQAAGELCARLGVAHSILAWEGDKPSTGIQAAARAVRYRLLTDHAMAVGADVVVTGHTLDDQIETYAMRQARSPQPAGGMSAAVLSQRRAWFMRPFLGVRRADIRDWLKGEAIGWVDDPSNDNPIFERVRVRHRLLADAPHADFATLSAERRGRAGEAAGLLGAHARILPLRVAVLDLAAFDGGNAAHMQALLHLVALTGGRPHPGGRETATRLATLLASANDGKITVERVLLQRRKGRLWMARERRGIADIEVAGGAIGLWDGRLRIVNRGRDAVHIGPGTAGMPLLLEESPPDIPKALARLIEETQPRLQETAANCFIEPVIPQFDQFVPADLLEIANILALLCGLDQFPELPTKQADVLRSQRLGKAGPHAYLTS